MKKLSRLGRAELGLDTIVSGKVFAFTPVVAKHCIGLGVAVANERGYYPVPTFYCHAKTWDEMAEHADELNAAEGLDNCAASEIVASTMR